MDIGLKKIKTLRWEGMIMSQISNIARATAVAAFGSVWLADDFGGKLCEHLGRNKPALHFGEMFTALEIAEAAKPGYELVHMADKIALPNLTPVPHPRTPGVTPVIPREVFVVEFDNILEKGLRVLTAQIEAVEFEMPPAHLMGKVDFVAGGIIAGPEGRYRVFLEYDADLGLNIVENPHILSERGYVVSKQVMAFFNAEDAAHEADQFAKNLVHAADWRSRSQLLAA